MMQYEPQIAYVLMADVRGYSLLEGDEQRIFYEKIMPEIGALCAKCSSQFKSLQTWGDAIAVCGMEAKPIALLAIELRDHFKHRGWDADHLPRLDIRISLHQGETYTGLNPITQVPTVIGPSLVMAARVEPLVKPGQVWATERFRLALQEAQRLSPAFAFDPIGELPLAKKFGGVQLHILRLVDEPPTPPESIAEIRAAHERGEGARDVERIAVGVVLRAGKVVLVRRRPKGGDPKLDRALSVMFPSGRALPSEDLEYRVAKEVKQEIGLSCKIEGSLGVRASPLEGNKTLHYFYLTPFDDTRAPVNADPDENSEVLEVEPARAISLMANLHDEVRLFLQRLATA